VEREALGKTVFMIDRLDNSVTWEDQWPAMRDYFCNIGETLYRMGHQAGAASAEARGRMLEVHADDVEECAAQANARVTELRAQLADQRQRWADYLVQGEGLQRTWDTLLRDLVSIELGKPTDCAATATLAKYVADLRAQLAALTAEREAMVAAGECPRKQG
jgi:hypothetical protein